MAMNWYLVHAKLRQEKIALLNLERQGYECYLPTLRVEKLRQRVVRIVEEALFPRYLFIRLDDEGPSKSWAPIRSTIGVHRLVSFGTTPARIDDKLIELLRRAQEGLSSSKPRPLFDPGERLMLSSELFRDVEAVFQMSDGEGRALVLIEMLNRPVQISAPLAGLRKTT